MIDIFLTQLSDLHTAELLKTCLRQRVAVPPEDCTTNLRKCLLVRVDCNGRHGFEDDQLLVEAGIDPDYSGQRSGDCTLQRE